MLWEWLEGEDAFSQRQALEKREKEFLERQGSKVFLPWQRWVVFADEQSFEAWLEELQTPLWGNQFRWGVVYRADEWFDEWQRAPLLLKKAQRVFEALGENTQGVFLSPALDNRRKIVSTVESIWKRRSFSMPSPSQRRGKVQALGVERGLSLSSEALQELTSFEPWSLGQVGAELDQIAWVGEALWREGRKPLGFSKEAWLQAFLERRRSEALNTLQWCTMNTPVAESLWLLGSLNWQIKQGVSATWGLLPGFQRPAWAKHWKASEWLELQKDIGEVDRALKTFFPFPKSLWLDLTLRWTLKSLRPPDSPLKTTPTNSAS